MPNIKVNDRFIASSLGINNYAKGICKIDSFLVFVDDLYQGETAIIEITDVKKNYAFAKVIEYKNTIKERAKDKCHHSHLSGTCPFNNITLDYENYIKTNMVKSNIERALNIKLDNIECLSLNENDKRNKITVFFNKLGEFGYFMPNTHNIVKIDDCIQIHSDILDLLNHLSTLVKEYNIPIFDYVNKTGIFKGVSIRRSDYNQKMTIMLLSTKLDNKYKDITKLLISKYSNIIGVSVSIIGKDTTVVYGKETTLYGVNYIEEKILGNLYRISNQSFLQVNTKGAELIYNTAIKMANLKTTDKVLDLYSGAGGISLSIAKYVKDVIGIEIVKDAVDSANYNKSINDINNVYFYNTDASNAKNIINNKKFDVIFVDPPRQGLSHDTIDFIIKELPRKIIYVSCDSYTLSNNLKELIRFYELDDIKVLNTFVSSRHSEVVCALSIKEQN